MVVTRTACPLQSGSWFFSEHGRNVCLSEIPERKNSASTGLEVVGWLISRARRKKSFISVSPISTTLAKGPLKSDGYFIQEAVGCGGQPGVLFFALGFLSGPSAPQSHPAK